MSAILASEASRLTAKVLLVKLPSDHSFDDRWGDDYEHDDEDDHANSSQAIAMTSTIRRITAIRLTSMRRRINGCDFSFLQRSLFLSKYWQLILAGILQCVSLFSKLRTRNS